MADNDIMKMKVADLKRELKNRGLNLVGNKQELQERLQSAILDGGDPLEDTGISEDLLDDEDVLNSVHDDDEELDEKSLLDGHEEAILRTPPKEEEKEEPVVPIVEKPAPKKVSLKRNVSISAPVLPSVEKIAIADTLTEESDSDATAKKVIKLTELTAEERKNLRAQKFGATTGSATAVSTDSKIAARAARFGLSASNDNTTKSNAITAVSAPTAEALKKRAERFGVTVSTELQKLENQDKLVKRQQRFGAGAAGDKVTTGGTDGATQDYAEKARIRAERFKTAV